MEERLNALKTDFISIIELKESNLQIFQTLNNRMTVIKQHYSDFIQSYKETLFVFTLDSFHFQGKLIDIEYEEMTRIYYGIMNKMYCEYYKLYKIVVEYVNENIKDDKIQNLIQANNQYPVYKDLEPYKQYDFHYTKELHETIIVILTAVNGFLLNKEHDLKVYQDKRQIGFNIDNFVNTLNFNNLMIREKVQLFITYIEFFHKMHSKYLSRFTTKMQLMLSQINYDIKFDGNIQNQNTTNKKVLKTLKQNLKGENHRELLSDVRHMITDEDTETTTDGNETVLNTEKTAIYHFIPTDNPSPSFESDEERDIQLIELHTSKREPVGQPREEPVGQPTEESVGQSREEPVEQSREEPLEQPREEPVGQPTEEPVGQSREEPVGQSREEPVGQPTEEPVEQPREEPVEQPREESVGQPTEEPIGLSEKEFLYY